MSKSKFNMCYPRYNKFGTLISYRFHYSGKEPLTGKFKQYTATWKIPQNLSKKEIETERKKFELIFVSECEKKLKGTFVTDENIRFGDFADQWLEEIKNREESYGSYSSAKNHLKIIKECFGNYLLKNITPKP